MKMDVIIKAMDFALRNPRRFRVLKIFCENPEMPVQEIAKRAGCGISTAYRHLSAVKTKHQGQGDANR